MLTAGEGAAGSLVYPKKKGRAAVHQRLGSGGIHRGLETGARPRGVAFAGTRLGGDALPDERQSPRRIHRRPTGQSHRVQPRERGGCPSSRKPTLQPTTRAGRRTLLRTATSRCVTESQRKHNPIPYPSHGLPYSQTLPSPNQVMTIQGQRLRAVRSVAWDRRRAWLQTNTLTSLNGNSARALELGGEPVSDDVRDRRDACPTALPRLRIIY